MRKSPVGTVGIIVVILGISIAGLLVWKSGFLIRAAGYQLIGDFNDVNGLLVGAQVRYRGYQVGQIERIYPRPTHVEVTFWIRREVDVPINSHLRVVFDGLVGEKYLNIIPNPTANKLVKSGDHLTGYSTSGLADFVDEGTKTLIQAKEILTEINKLAQDHVITDSIRKTVDNICQISQGMRQLTDTLFVNGHADKHLLQTADQLNKLTANLVTATHALSVFMTDSNVKLLPQKANATLDNFSAVATGLNKLISDPAVQSDIKGILKNSRQVVSQASGFLQTVSDVQTKATIGLSARNGSLAYDGNLDIGIQDRFLRVGPDHIQAGMAISPKTTARIGAMYGQPGIGVDYQFTPALAIGADVYNPNQPDLDIMGSWELSRAWTVRVGESKLMSPDHQTRIGLFYTW